MLSSLLFSIELYNSVHFSRTCFQQFISSAIQFLCYRPVLLFIIQSRYLTRMDKVQGTQVKGASSRLPSSNVSNYVGDAQVLYVLRPNFNAAVVTFDHHASGLNRCHTIRYTISTGNSKQPLIIETEVVVQIQWFIYFYHFFSLSHETATQPLNYIRHYRTIKFCVG